MILEILISVAIIKSIILNFVILFYFYTQSIHSAKSYAAKATPIGPKYLPATFLSNFITPFLPKPAIPCSTNSNATTIPTASAKHPPIVSAKAGCIPIKLSAAYERSYGSKKISVFPLSINDSDAKIDSAVRTIFAESRLPNSSMISSSVIPYERTSSIAG